MSSSSSTPSGNEDTQLLVSNCHAIFLNADLYKKVLKCEGAEAQNLLDAFQWLLDRPGLDMTFRRHLIVATQRLVKKSNLYPTCYELGNIVQEGQLPIEAGGFADIYKGWFEGQPVCLKAIRVYQATRVEYVMKAMDVAEGLAYLHENGIVHGDLKGDSQPNILIDSTGRARLADFGLSAMSDPQILAWTSVSSAASKGGSIRWQAPELFDIDEDRAVKNTPASDVYAWSCVAFEIFTNSVPFAELQRESTIELRIMAGARPTRPSDLSSSWNEWGLTPSIWSLMGECWESDPNNRPKMPQIIVRLGSEPGCDAQLHDHKDDLDPAHFRRRVRNHAVDIRSASARIDHILAQVPPVPGSSSLPTLRESPSDYQDSLPPINTSPQAISFPDELNLTSIAPESRKEGSDWFADFNPEVNQTLDISLVHSLEHTRLRPHSPDILCENWSEEMVRLPPSEREKEPRLTNYSVLAHDSVEESGVYIRSVRFSPDGKLLVTGADDRQIRVWDIAKKRLKNVFVGHTQEIYSLDFSLDGRFIISAGDETARIWDMHDDSSKVLIINDMDSLNNDAGGTSVAISPSGQLIATGSLDAVVRIWDVSTGALLEKLKGHQDSVYSVAFTPDGRGLVSGSLDKTLKYWDVSALAMRKDELVLKKPDDKPSSSCTMDFVGHKDYVLSASVSHDGQWLVSGSKDLCVQFWDIRDATPQFVLQGHKNSVLSVDVNAAGNMFATGSGDGSVRIWRYNTVP
ncbi:hypothetical protein DXG01_007483 [Tephrocybe rancida]|nr:hypothetical protein DXG01_007483 [Tephrocybe rancida]